MFATLISATKVCFEFRAETECRGGRLSPEVSLIMLSLSWLKTVKQPFCFFAVVRLSNTMWVSLYLWNKSFLFHCASQTSLCNHTFKFRCVFAPFRNEILRPPLGHVWHDFTATPTVRSRSSWLCRHAIITSYVNLSTVYCHILTPPLCKHVTSLQPYIHTIVV